MKRIDQALQNQSLSKEFKENNWLSLSIEEKQHISTNLKKVFLFSRTSNRWWNQDDPLFGEYNKKLNVRTENKKFSVWAAKKHKVIEVLDFFKITIDFNKPKEVLDFARYCPSILFSTGHLLESKSFVLDALRMKPKLLPFLNDKLRDNESIVEAAITTYKSKNNSKLLRYASERLRGSKKFMKGIIQTCPGSFPFLTKKLRKDKELIDIYKSKISQIKSVDELNGLPAKEKIKFLKNGYFRGISMNWLKLQPKVLREDKELVFKFMLRHTGYNPYLFPQFDRIKEYFKGEDLFKAFVKYYLLALFISFEEILRHDEYGNNATNRIYKSHAEFDNYEVPFHIKEKTSSFKVLDVILNCLGHEGLVYSQKIDYSAAFLPQAFEFVDEVDDTYEGNNAPGTHIEFHLAMRQFYDFIREHEKVNLFEKALADKLSISSNEFNHTKTTQINQEDNLRLNYWFDMEDGPRLFNRQDDIPF